MARISSETLDMFLTESGEYDAVDGILDDLANQVRNAVNDTGREVVDRSRQVVTDRGAGLVTDLINSTEFSRVLSAVEDSAKKAVVAETKKNALALLGLAVAGGGIGGMVFKGKSGAAMATGLAVFSLWMIWQGAGAPKPQGR